MVVAYWSMTGNTQAMAEAIGEGITGAGVDAVVKHVGDLNPADFANEKTFALGCPSMGDEVLEESEMEPFVAEVEKYASGKNIALFGSYGWGDGQWMRDWVERMENAGAIIVGGEGLIVNETPDDDGLAKCKALGASLAAKA